MIEVSIWQFVPWIVTCVALCAAFYQRGKRIGFKEAEKIMRPILDLSSKWAELHLAAEKRDKGEPHEKETD